MTLSRYQQPLGLFLLAAFLLILKSPDAVTAPQFWAEDGPVFFATQFGQRWPQLFTPYAGYLHTVSRLVAWGASWGDVAQAPRLYNTVAIVIDAGCIAYVALRMAPWFGVWPVLVSFFIVPTMGDIFGTITNVHWFMQFAVAAACFVPSASTRALRMVGLVLLALAALSGPFSLLIAAAAIGALLTTLVPAAPVTEASRASAMNVLLAIRAAGGRVPKANVAVVAVCACVQAAVLMTHTMAMPDTLLVLTESQKASLGLLSQHFVYNEMVNYPLAPRYSAELVAVAAVLLAFLVQTVRRPSAWAGIACMLLAVGAVQPVLAYARQHAPASLNITARYAFLLSVVVCWIGWRLFSDAMPAWRKRAAIALAAAFAIAVVVRPDFFRRQPLYDLAWDKYAAQIRHAGPAGVVVPVNPAYWNFKVQPHAAP